MFKYSDLYRKNTPSQYLNERFIKWVDKVEYKFNKKYNMYLLDIPDQLYMHYFENGLSPNDMFNIIEEEVIDEY